MTLYICWKHPLKSTISKEIHSTQQMKILISEKEQGKGTFTYCLEHWSAEFFLFKKKIIPFLEVLQKKELDCSRNLALVSEPLKVSWPHSFGTFSFGHMKFLPEEVRSRTSPCTQNAKTLSTRNPTEPLQARPASTTWKTPLLVIVGVGKGLTLS